LIKGAVASCSLYQQFKAANVGLKWDKVCILSGNIGKEGHKGRVKEENEEQGIN
jgi:hypothetical protein